MNDLMALRALRAVGTLTEGDDYVILTINGHSKTIRKGPSAKIMRAVCRHHAVWVINNLGKALLKLPVRHAGARPDCKGDLCVTPEDIACVKAVLASIGSTVQLVERFVLLSGQPINDLEKTTTLRVGDFLYIQPPSETIGEKNPIVAIVTDAASDIIKRILERRDEVAVEEVQLQKKKERAAQQAQYRAEKKRRIVEGEPVPEGNS